ncbi:MAG: Do family serine endopeptidase [Chitinophagales bacterium]
MNLRKTALTAFTAFISAFAAIGVYNHMGWNKQEVTFVDRDAPTAHLTAYSASQSQSMPIDFRYAASASTPAVVHIKSTFKPEKTSYRGRSNDPFQDLFGDDFYNYFHGGNPYQNQAQVATGSGVIVSPDGYIVTNNHVVENASEIEVVMNNQKTYTATVTGRDPDVDLALLKVEATDLPAINFANSDSALVGEWVLAVGNPFNLESTVTAGIISAKGRNISLLGDSYGNGKGPGTSIESFIQTDAAVNPGNSGGALVNVNGELVGINTAIASPTGSYAGYSFAVPSNIVKKVIIDLKQYGVTQRGFLGVSIRTMDDKTAQDLGFDKPHGVYLDNVNKGSAAEEAGLKNKDVITAINGFPVNTSPELQEQVAKYRPGDKIAVEYIRSGNKGTATVVLKNKYNTTASVDNSTNVLDVLGVEVENLSATDLRALGLSGGVRVTGLKNGRLTEFTDIKKGFVITQIDDQPVTSVNDFLNLLKDKSGKVLIEGIYPNKPMSYLYAFRM